MRLGGNQVLLLTPFTPELAVDEESLHSLLAHVIGGGVDGLIPLGTTGEFFALDVEEKRRVVDVTLEHATGKVPVCVGVGHSATEPAAALARYAARRGAAAVLLPPPYYYPTGPEAMRLHFEGVARAVDIPVVLYDGGGGVEIPPGVIAAVNAEHPNVCMVKASVLSSGRVRLLRDQLGDRVTVLCGDEVMLLSQLAEGAAGMATAVGNLMPRIASEICHFYREGRPAEARQRYLRCIAPWVVSAGIIKSEFIRCFKEALASLRIIGSPATRPPIPPLSRARRDDVIGAVEHLRTEGALDV